MAPSRLAVVVAALGIAACSLIDIDDLADGAGAAPTTVGSGATTSGTGSTTQGTTSPGTGSTSASSIASGSTSGGASYADVVLADQPAAYFRLDDVGPDAFDEVSQSFRGAMVGDLGWGQPSLGPSLGTCIVMYGPDHVEVADATGFDWQEDAPFSIELWLNVAEEDLVPGTVGHLVGRESGPAPSEGFFVGLSIPTIDADVGTLVFGSVVGGAEASVTVEGVGTEGFRHVVATYERGTARLYVDGVEAGMGTMPGYVGAGPFRFGAGVGVETQYDGHIDEVALYGRALTLEDVARHFEAAAP